MLESDKDESDDSENMDKKIGLYTRFPKNAKVHKICTLADADIWSEGSWMS